LTKYRFLIGWIDGSDSASDPTGIESQEDLLNGKADIFEFELPDGMDGYAWRVGASYAFSANFTAHDSLSMVQKLVNGVWE
jgi:hypothetical protein